MIGALRATLFAACVAACAAACSRTPATQGPPGDAAKGCPLGMVDAQVSVADTPGGVALTVTAAPSRLDELRHRVRDVAALYGPGAHKGLGFHGKHMGAQRHGLRLSEMPPVSARVDEVEGGARLALDAKLPGDRELLRSRARARVDEIVQGPCDWPTSPP